MKPWDESSINVSKITPNKEKAKSLLQVVELREKDLKPKALKNDNSLLSLLCEC